MTKQKYDGYSGNEDNTFTNEIKLSYIDIPILFRVSSPKGPFFEIGPQVSLLMGAKETFEFEKSSTSNYSDKDVKDDFAGFGVAGVLGFGIDIKLTDMINLTTGLRFGYMFTDATTEYSQQELDVLDDLNALSGVSTASHLNTENKLDYQKSNRAFGGLQIGIQFMLDKK
ncbi:MAG: PorT family protein [Bacteroidetes bacterium]|nr:PorT family protein [Bacteroidota bacterium]